MHVASIKFYGSSRRGWGCNCNENFFQLLGELTIVTVVGDLPALQDGHIFT